MKTKGMAHQLEGLRRSEGKRGFAYFCEQGTGKTWMLLADGERAYIGGKIDAILVFAPKGVHVNWVTREIPTHMEGNVLARYWTKTGGKKRRQWLEEIFNPRPIGGIPPLRVLTMNFDAVNTKDGYDFARRFLLATKCFLFIDESGRIKNPAALRTKRILELRKLAVAARIATGTPITNSPPDIFSQMEVLRSGLLGTTSYRAFVAEYAELLDTSDRMFRNMVAKNPRAAHAQVVARDAQGRKKWRNLDKLRKLLEPHSYRVLKKDCLDLPEKIYQTRPFELSPTQQAAYDRMEDQQRILLTDGSVVAVKRLAALMKLQQITSGYVMVPARPGQEPEMQYLEGENPRLEAFMDMVEDMDPDASVIVWARFRPEIAAIAKRLKAAGETFVEYHGGIDEAAREAAVDDFQAGRARFFIGNAQSAGIGLTLTRAEQVVYFSNSFNLEDRLQSEDRAHRIGQKKHVLYTDLIAQGTIDRSIVRALQNKQEVAAYVQGDLSRGRAEDN